MSLLPRRNSYLPPYFWFIGTAPDDERCVDRDDTRIIVKPINTKEKPGDSFGFHEKQTALRYYNEIWLVANHVKYMLPRHQTVKIPNLSNPEAVDIIAFMRDMRLDERYPTLRVRIDEFPADVTLFVMLK